VQEKLKQLEKYRATITAGGGPKRIQKHHESGKKTARERLELFFDHDTFVEVSTFTGSPDMENLEYPGEGCVTGYGNINGRLAYMYAQDFTVQGGSLGKIHANKICKMLDLGLKNGAPVIGISDSGGARIQEGIDSLDGYGNIFFRNTAASGVVPQITIIMGPCAGGAVYSPALQDFVFMVDNMGQMFITGPQVIKAVTGEEVTMEELGGSYTHNMKSGVAHFRAATEEECADMIKKLLSYLPSNNQEKPPAAEPKEPVGDPMELRNIVPNSSHMPYDVKDILSLVLDGGEIFEVHSMFATNAVVGFGRMDGQVVGIIANQANFLAGCLDIDASDKIARFVRFCDCFNIPMITFVDVPGYLPGTEQEYGGIIRHGAKILYAYSEATVPKITIILRKAYGGAYIGMCSSSLRADVVYAWPSAEIAVMGPEGAVNIISRKEIEGSPNPEETRMKLIEEYRAKFANPYISGARGYVDDVIDPVDTRKKIIASLKSLAGKKETRPAKKHGNFPV